MEAPDELDDLAITANRDVFGRTVMYAPDGGGASVELEGRWAPREATAASGTLEWEAREPWMEFRALDLEDESIDPNDMRDGLLTFSLRGTSVTMRISQVHQSEVGLVSCSLSRRP